MNRTLSGATTLGLRRHRSDGNKGVLCIPQSSSITGASSSDCLMSKTPPHEEGSVLVIICFFFLGQVACFWQNWMAVDSCILRIVQALLHRVVEPYVVVFCRCGSKCTSSGYSGVTRTKKKYKIMISRTGLFTERVGVTLWGLFLGSNWPLLILWHYVGGSPSRRSLCLFWRETKQRVWDRDLQRDRKRGDVREKPEGELAKRDAERQSRKDSRREQSRWVSSPVLDGQQREAVKEDSQEWTQWGRRSKLSWHS